MSSPSTTATSTTPSSQQQQQQQQWDRICCRDTVIMVSRVVWEHVVSPGWLEKPDTDTGFRWGDLFRAAEAMFPIVALVCTRILSARYYYVGSYGATMSAASVPAPSCVAWILNNRQNGRLDQRIAGIRLLGLDHHHPTAVMTATTTTTTTEPTPDGGDSREIGARKEEGDRRRLRDGNDDDGDEDDVYAREVGATVVKEVSTTVAGLLIGGHVGIAELLLGGGARIEDHDGDGGGVVGVKKKGTLPRLWDGRSVVRWGNACRTTNDNGLRLREKVIEYLKTESGVRKFFQDICVYGGVDAARWLVGVLGIGVTEAPWVMYQPLLTCMSAGKMEVVKWMSEKFGLGRNLHQTAFSYLYYSCAWSPCSTRNLKWCLENFPGEPNMSMLTSAIVLNKHSTVEDLQWPCVGEYLPSRCYEYMLYSVHNPDVVKWWLTTFPPHPPPSEDELNHVCMNTGNVELTQWLVTEQGFTPTAETFVSACSTSRKKGSTLAKWLSTRVSLSQNDIIKSLVCALRWSNIEVAEWLDEAFHVMDVVNSSPKFAEYCLVEICREYNKDKVVGLEWFLQHLSHPSTKTIDMGSIHKAISLALEYRVNSVVLLLEKFSSFEPHKDPVQFENLTSTFMKDNLKGLQLLCTGSGSALLTSEFVGHCLTSQEFHPYSSKVVKWVIRKFNVQYTQIKANNNLLLFKLISRNKNRCAQWLINTFDIPLDDILSMAQLSDDNCIDLTGWHMILNHYGPTIDATLIRKHLMPLVSRSPHVAIHTISSFGLTIHEYRDYVQQGGKRGEPFSSQVKLWLGITL